MEAEHVVDDDYVYFFSISLSIDMLYQASSVLSVRALLLTRSVNILPDTETEASADDIST